MRLTRWIAAAGFAAAVTVGTLAAGAGAASADAVSIVRDGCRNAGGIWNNLGYDRDIPFQYTCTMYYSTATWTYYYRPTGEYYRLYIGNVNSDNLHPF
ncbi:hypothetical protein J5X84_35465 [Streptosporangiaceae bacterium NEAU-GS5]|nr:hypothetical protein [Streptosporangiaceae bacterium NEAU-GS5]